MRMKRCGVLAPTLWSVAIGSLVGRPIFPQFASFGKFGTATVLGAIITNAYISIDNVVTPAEGVACNHAGRPVW